MIARVKTCGLMKGFHCCLRMSTMLYPAFSWEKLGFAGLSLLLVYSDRIRDDSVLARSAV